MRDKKRIKPILARLEKLWNKHPELRLGQLISNYITDPALYYIEDEQLLYELEDRYEVKK